MESVFKAAGKAFKKSFDAKVKADETASVISIPSEGDLASKAVYFVPWKPSTDPDKLRQSIELLVKNVMKKAASEDYRSIAFPAIGCGEYGCDIPLIAKTFIGQVRELLERFPVPIVFVIQPGKNEIYDAFTKEIGPGEEQEEVADEPVTSSAVGKGTIEVQKGDITKQKVSIQERIFFRI